MASRDQFQPKLLCVSVIANQGLGGSLMTCQFMIQQSIKKKVWSFAQISAKLISVGPVSFVEQIYVCLPPPPPPVEMHSKGCLLVLDDLSPPFSPILTL